MVEQRIHERSVEIPRRGVNDQPGRLFHDQQMLVFKDNSQRNVLRLVVRRSGLGNRDPKRFLATNLGGRVAKLPAAGFYRAAADQGLQALARQSGNRRGERAVEAPPRMGGLQAHIDRLNSPHS